MAEFSDGFRRELRRLMLWRRDVRRFDTRPVAPEALSVCLEAMRLAPSVGLCEPVRLLRVASATARAAALANFEAANAAALAGYSGDRATTYAGLKLSGMREAPVQLAVFCDEAPEKGAGLGAQTMPEMRRYSCVAAVMNFWLAARAAGLGVGWVSILDPQRLSGDLGAPPEWTLIAYLCVGHPLENDDAPELERLGWERRAAEPPAMTEV